MMGFVAGEDDNNVANEMQQKFVAMLTAIIQRFTGMATKQQRQRRIFQLGLVATVATLFPATLLFLFILSIFLLLCCLES